MSKNEGDELRNLILDFIKEKKDNFNSHYIQLLAWHIDDIKIMKIKAAEGEKFVSFLEYDPPAIFIFSMTNKIFSLFDQSHIESEKVSAALLLNYLENYEKTSQRFKNVLKKYLRTTNHSKIYEIYFDFEKLRIFIDRKKLEIHQKPLSGGNFLENLLKSSGINEKILATKYFRDALNELQNL